MSSFELSVRASTELLEIYLFGIEYFGVSQADRYIDSLESCFSKLADFPRLGRSAIALGPGLRRHEHQSHVIFYEEIAQGVRIISVQHRRRIPRLDPD